MFIKNHYKKILLITLGILLILSVTLTYLYFHNFHTLIPNAVYRSNQLSKLEFAHAIEQYHVKSIINLRRDYPAAWYTDEIDISQAKNVQHYDVGMAAYALPDPKLLSQLVQTLEEAPRPVLIHCQGGSDRSGLASAILLILGGETSLPVINHQISYYPYFVIHSDSVGKLVLERYETWLKENHLTSSRENFLTWVKMIQEQGW